MVWDSLPSLLAKENKKFIYGAVRKSGRAKDFEVAITWLKDAGLIYKILRVSMKNYIDQIFLSTQLKVTFAPKAHRKGKVYHSVCRCSD